MRGWVSLVGLALMVAGSTPVRAEVQGLSVSALRLWPFDDDAERQVRQARISRLHLDFSTAAALLDEAAGKDPYVEPLVQHERGLLARDRGDLEHALGLLKRAADMDPVLLARVDQAGVLVQLGRWPEAVTVLRQAFDERGTSLPVEQVTGDKRFVRLATLKPYLELIEAVRNEQAGPLGHVVLRLERLQSSVTAAEHGLKRLAAWFGFFRQLAGAPLISVLLLLVMVFFTFGVNQLALLRPPWTLAAGMLLASALWVLATRTLTAGQSSGQDILLPTWGVGLSLWLLLTGVRWLWRRYQRMRRGTGDPFASEHLADTLLLVDEVSRLGHRVVGARRRQQRVLIEALRQAGETLRERLDRGA